MPPFSKYQLNHALEWRGAGNNHSGEASTSQEVPRLRKKEMFMYEMQQSTQDKQLEETSKHFQKFGLIKKAGTRVSGIMEVDKVKEAITKLEQETDMEWTREEVPKTPYFKKQGQMAKRPLKKMVEVMHLPDPTGGMWSGKRTVMGNLGAILDASKPLLFDSAFIKMQGRRQNPLLRPLSVDGDPRGQHTCILFQKSKVDASNQFQMLASGYVLVCLAKHNGLRVMEYMHRLVAYSFWGPPSSNMGKAVAMHICHNKRCINPNHIVWGTYSQNKNPSEEIYTLAVEEQHFPHNSSSSSSS